MLITKIVNLLQEDINEGKRGYCCLCPVALAVARAFGIDDLHSAKVYVTRTFVDISGVGSGIRLPVEVTVFIRAFDKSEPVAPFSFPITYDAPEAA